MYNISNEDRQELLKYLSTQPYANVFKLVAMIVGLKKAPGDKSKEEKVNNKSTVLNINKILNIFFEIHILESYFKTRDNNKK